MATIKGSKTLVKTENKKGNEDTSQRKNEKGTHTHRLHKSKMYNFYGNKTGLITYYYVNSSFNTFLSKKKKDVVTFIINRKL